LIPQVKADTTTINFTSDTQPHRALRHRNFANAMPFWLVSFSKTVEDQWEVRSIEASTLRRPESESRESLVVAQWRSQAEQNRQDYLFGDFPLHPANPIISFQ
jgi:hypothetical protein